MGREEIYTNMFANFMDLSIKDKLLLDFGKYVQIPEGKSDSITRS